MEDADWPRCLHVSQKDFEMIFLLFGYLRFCALTYMV